ncbi:4'-phosphopantetheinyl transferase superfamily protein [Massilia sp. HP4]|uniref:4'-phosphopantetheinyl transferase family protein n=1 Tax=Massilia sp. HP4 TaxID=2562316 RepID=UPI0010C148A7|nr:4'-phosphopantetheinyl transferase superfamily protein [Massilia sp. HP4]
MGSLPSPVATVVWLLDSHDVAPDALASYAAWLGPSERARCARFVRAERRRQFVLGRALLRVALGRLLQRQPDTIVLDERPGQAPVLVGEPDAGFSISHSGRWVACAAGRGMRLGLDIERLDMARDVMALAGQAFGAAEVAVLQALDPQARRTAFYRMWCAHEARFKLGCPSAIEYPLETCELLGVLAVSSPLAQAPDLTPVRLRGL